MNTPTTPEAKLPLTDRQLKIALNAVHERGMKALNLWELMHTEIYLKPSGKPATEADRDEVKAFHMEHLELVEAIRKIRTENVQVLAPP